MKRILNAGLFALLVAGAHAETDAEYLARKITVGYLHNPYTTTPSWTTINPADVIAGNGSGPFYTAPESEKLRELVNAMFKSGNTGGVDHGRFQRILAAIVKFRDLPIQVLLVNDNSGPLTSVTAAHGSLWINTNRHIWPYANKWNPPRAVGSGSFGGLFSFGNWELNNNAQFNRAAYRLGVFLHEMTHTQDTSEWRGHLFGPYSYGVGGHSVDEIVPDLAAAYGEGIANFMHMWLDTTEATNRFNWFKDNQSLVLIDRQPPAPAPGATSGVVAGHRYAFQQIAQLSARGINPLTASQFPPAYQTWFAGINATKALYTIDSLPADFVGRNEEIMALVIHHSAQLIGFSRMDSVYRRAIRSTDMTSSPMYGNFVHFMAEAANGGPINSSPGPTTAVRGFYPLALFDYFTRFKATDKAAYKQALEFGTGPDEWVDAYFDSGFRQRVKDSINLSTLSTADIGRIRTALNLAP